MTKCDHCPFRDDLDTACVVEATGHARLCARLDPASPLHREDGRAAVVRLTLEPLGRWTPPPPPERVTPPEPAPAPAAMPSLARQAAHLASDIAAAARSGFKSATPEEQMKRLAICEACPDLIRGRCRHCGCRMQYRATQEAWRCPIGKF